MVPIIMDLYAKTGYMQDTNTVLTTVGAVTIAVGVSKYITPFVLPYVKPVWLGIKVLPVIGLTLNSIRQKQEAHQEVLAQLNKNMLEVHGKITYNLEEFKTLYLNNTEIVVSSMNSFIKAQQNQLDVINKNISLMINRINELTRGVQEMYSKIKDMKGSAGPKELTYHKDDEADAGSAGVVKALKEADIPLIDKKHTYIEEIYNNLKTTQPSPLIVNMFSEAITLTDETLKLEPLREIGAEKIVIESPSIIKTLTAEEEQKTQIIANNANSNIIASTEKLLLENKEILEQEPLPIEKIYAENDRVIIKRKPYWEQDSLFLTKSIIATMLNNTAGVTISASVISVSVGSLGLKLLDNGIGLTVPANDGAILTKVSNSLLYTGGLMIISSMLMPKIAKGLKATGSQVQESLDKTTIYENNKTMESTLKDFEEEGLSPEQVLFQSTSVFSSVVTYLEDFKSIDSLKELTGNHREITKAVITQGTNNYFKTVPKIKEGNGTLVKTITDIVE